MMLTMSCFRLEKVVKKSNEMNIFMKNKADFSAQAFHVVQRLIDEKSFFHLKANNIGEQTPVEQQ
jgi:hypothetical protein